LLASAAEGRVRITCSRRWLVLIGASLSLTTIIFVFVALPGRSPLFLSSQAYSQHPQDVIRCASYSIIPLASSGTSRLQASTFSFSLSLNPQCLSISSTEASGCLLRPSSLKIFTLQALKIFELHISRLRFSSIETSRPQSPWIHVAGYISQVFCIFLTLISRSAPSLASDFRELHWRGKQLGRRRMVGLACQVRCFFLCPAYLFTDLNATIWMSLAGRAIIVVRRSCWQPKDGHEAITGGY
jgi:hypothetical protein